MYSNDQIGFYQLNLPRLLQVIFEIDTFFQRHLYQTLRKIKKLCISYQARYIRLYSEESSTQTQMRVSACEHHPRGRLPPFQTPHGLIIDARILEVDP